MFSCTKCGICCQNISQISELKNYDLGDGTCKYFNILSQECDIYDTRPTVCSIDKMYEVLYAKHFTKQEFYSLNSKACNLMQEENGIDTKYRMKIGE